MFQGMYSKQQGKSKSWKSNKKEAAANLFKSDMFKSDKSNKSKKNNIQNDSTPKNSPRSAKTKSEYPALNCATSFETRDRLLSSVHAYMALFCSLSDAGVSLSTSVHSALSEIGYTQIAGQLTKGFNELNDIGTATFDNMKSVVEDIIAKWEDKSSASSSITTKVIAALTFSSPHFCWC